MVASKVNRRQNDPSSDSYDSLNLHRERTTKKRICFRENLQENSKFGLKTMVSHFPQIVP
jgi:hypothetical protein